MRICKPCVHQWNHERRYHVSKAAVFERQNRRHVGPRVECILHLTPLALQVCLCKSP
jgi:hypothetical protein